MLGGSYHERPGEAQRDRHHTVRLAAGRRLGGLHAGAVVFGANIPTELISVIAWFKRRAVGGALLDASRSSLFGAGELR